MTKPSDEARYRASDLTGFAAALFAAAGCDGDKPAVVAAGLVEADLLGHTTHGLQLAPVYLGDLASGGMTARGEPEVVVDRGACVTWDGKRLPGVWLAARAVDLATERATTYGVATVVIRRSHHIGCLAAYLQRATDRGLMITVTCSDPAVATVAPFGGRKAVYTPDPLAVGIPTTGDPILIDISASITTNGMAGRLRRARKRFPGPWALDAAGRPTDDPNALFTDPPGTLLPVGGTEYGHKGYGLRARDRGLDARAKRVRAGRSAVRVGCVRVRAGNRPGRVRRRRGIPAADRVAGGRLSGLPAGARGGRGTRSRSARGLELKRKAARRGRRALPGHHGRIEAVRGEVRRDAAPADRVTLTPARPSPLRPTRPSAGSRGPSSGTSTSRGQGPSGAGWSRGSREHEPASPRA